jgi:hypothetical protein
LTIAIVVFVVTDLGRRLDFSYTSAPVSGITGLYALLAFPCCVCATGASLTCFATTDTTLVGLTITVVVLSIAHFCCWIDVPRTSAPFSGSTGLFPQLAGPHTADTAGTSLAILATTDTTFVGLPITIVVFVVTDFRLRIDESNTSPPLSGGTGLGSTLAFADIGATAKTSLAGLALAGIFIDLTITIVVLAITDLRLRHRRRASAILSTSTGLSTCSTRGFTALCQAFVGLTIAIVVLAITHLWLRIDMTNASAPLPGGTGLNPQFASADTGATARTSLAGLALTDTAFIHLSVTIVVFVVTDFRLRVDESDTDSPLSGGAGLSSSLTLANISAAAKSGLSSFALAKTAFIDLTVTIVVLAVTDFWFRVDESDTSAPLSGGTGLGSTLAFANIGATTKTSLAGLALTDTAFVHLSVTVVVFTVTDLRLRIDKAYTGSPVTASAGLCTAFALTDVSSTTKAGLSIGANSATFVSLTITIVVTSVTHFCRGGGSRTTPPSAARTDLSPRTTGISTGSGDIFIDLTITIVVTTIAGFSGRIDRSKALCAPTPVETDLLTCATSPGVGSASTELPGTTLTTFIGAPITIVVASIADLGSGLGSRTVYPFPCVTGLGSFATGIGAGLCEVFVDQSVTVVVLAVTDLLSGTDA